MSTANERNSRITTNEAMDVERRARAVQDEYAALLNMLKAAKELESLDLNHIRELIEMQGLIKAQESPVPLAQPATKSSSKPASKPVATKKPAAKKKISNS